MPLSLDAGFSSLQGRRKNNEDSCLVITPSTGQYLAYGALLAVADGVGGLPGGLEASSAAVKALRDSYYASPETWGLARALKDCFDAANQAVLTAQPTGCATTLAALVLRQRRWAVGHVGDSRVYLYRNQQITQLTRDHARVHADIGAVITRACGLDARLDTDADSGDLSVGDVFILSSDGVHESLSPAAMLDCLHSETAQEIAEQLTRGALAAGSNDNVSACVVRILKLPAERVSDLGENSTALPIKALPGIGESLDGYYLIERLHSGRMSSLYKALDTESGATLVLKFPNPRYADDQVFIDYFLKEEWIGRRINSPYVVKIAPLRAGRRTALYTAMEFCEGETLAARISKKNGLGVQETLALARQILTGLDHLHRKGVIHRDVKPENMLVDEHNQLRLIDLGVSHVERLSDREPNAAPIGTPSYMAPELIDHQEATERADIYSAGVTIYQMLTGKYPYGEIEPFTHPRFNRFVPPERYNPDVPGWLSEVLRKACAANPEQRFEFACELETALSNAPATLTPRRKLPLLERILPEHWKVLFLVSVGVNLLLILLHLL